MSILYELLSVEDLKELSEENKVELISEIILTGRYDYFQKFKSLFDKEVPLIISSNKILELIPMNIDVELFEYILNSYNFAQGQHFFYNYAKNSDDMRIREIVYNYFIDNYSHVVVDNMSMYEELLSN